MEHGGDLADASKHYGIDAADWLDLSTGINPQSYPFGTIPSDRFARLPESTHFDELDQAARTAYGVCDRALVVAAPGTQALIQLLPSMRLPGRVAIVGPTYSEHETTWRAAGHSVTNMDELSADTADIVVLVNPNNPDGHLYDPERLLALATRLASRDGLLVVDEAFVDADPEVSLAPHAGTPGLAILRSFGKFYGLAGLRLGFALTEPDLGARLTKALGPWAVSGPALWVGTRALNDRTWALSTQRSLAGQCKALDDALVSHGLAVSGGTALFRLALHEEAPRLHSALAEQGVWVRKFSYAPSWLRFGLPGSDTALARLDTALSAAIAKISETQDSHAAVR